MGIHYELPVSIYTPDSRVFNDVFEGNKTLKKKIIAHSVLGGGRRSLSTVSMHG